MSHSQPASAAAAADLRPATTCQDDAFIRKDEKIKPISWAEKLKQKKVKAPPKKGSVEWARKVNAERALAVEQSRREPKRAASSYSLRAEAAEEEDDTPYDEEEARIYRERNSRGLGGRYSQSMVNLGGGAIAAPMKKVTVAPAAEEALVARWDVRGKMKKLLGKKEN
ncbi:hypothetical protein EG329_000220 [Mollisiaceae sp. DMI_Dod_QoI]|nr:hypothetical protein EG329_000220 [Helotiales sp. DMI_Dod_QoI]